MIRCPNCGVELEGNANFCSLCGEPILEKTLGSEAIVKSDSELHEEKLFSDYRRFTVFQKRKLFWSVSGLILISGFITTFLIDIIGNQDITWSKYPLTISLFLYINITLYTFLFRKITLMLVLSFLSAAGLFVLFDIYAGITGWDNKLGLPLLFAFYVTFFVLIFFIRKSKQKGLNVIAWTLTAAGFICIYTEGMISIFLNNALYFGWSLIVLVSVVFISFILLYIHYRLKKVTDLKRFFHI